MKLLYKILSRLSVALVVLMAAWAAVFYFIMVDEINDETDDALEDYAHYIMMRALAGEELPSNDNGTNNTYYLKEVGREYADRNPKVRYLDETVYIYAKQETEPARVLKTIFRDSEDRFHELTVAIPSFEKDDLQRKILVWIVILYVVLLLAVLLVNAWVLNRSFKPLYALLGWFDDFRLGGEVTPPEGRNDVTEFRKLKEAAMRSARRQNEVFEEQRSFIGNASHELQTPIAVCQNRLEMLADDPSLGERQLEQVVGARRTLAHMSRLNRNLLLLSKIDNGQVGEPRDVDVNLIVEGLLEDYTSIYASNGIETALNDSGRFVLRMDETLASVLFGNLLKNAFVHTGPDGVVRVDISDSSFSVENTAAGDALDPDRIFRRFYKGAGNKGSSGLGLALADSVCRLYGLVISYGFENGMHRFTVRKK